MPMRGVKMSKELIYLDHELIEVPEWTRMIPREYLRESVEDKGIIVPIVVGKIKDGKKNRYILIDGYGRLQLAKEQGLEQVPVRLVEIENEDEALLLAIELQKSTEAWSLGYTVQVIKILLDRGYTKTEIAEKLKIPRSKIYRLLSILDYPPEIQQRFFKQEWPLRAVDDINKTLNMLKEHFPERIEAFFNDLKGFSEWDIVCGSYYDTAQEFLARKQEKEEEPEETVPVEKEETKLLTPEQVMERVQEVTVEVPEEPETEQQEEEQEEEKEEGKEKAEKVKVKLVTPQWAQNILDKVPEGWNAEYLRYSDDVYVELSEDEYSVVFEITEETDILNVIDTVMQKLTELKRALSS